MYVSPYKYTDQVTSEPLEVVSFSPYGTIYEWMRDVRHKYGVSLSLSTDDPRDSVRVSGPYGVVYTCIAKMWGDNETEETMEYFVDAMLGDRLAEFYWNGHRDADESDDEPGKLSIASVPLDAFNLFVGAAIMFEVTQDERVWVVMDFQDGGEGAISVAEEKVKVRLRDATEPDEDVKVRDWIFDYNDKVHLIGNVRNPNDLDDNNWGQNF